MLQRNRTEAVDASNQMLAEKKPEVNKLVPNDKGDKARENKDFVDLHFTGEFHSAMKFTEITAEYAELTSTDWNNN